MLARRGLYILLLIGLAIALRHINLNAEKTASRYPVFQKGMTFANWTKDGYATFASDDALKELAKTKTEWVALIVTWYQDRSDSKEIKPTYKTPTDESLIHAIKQMRSLGMKVMLKPQLDLLNTSAGKSRADIEFTTPEDWQVWFDSYRKFILHYVEMATAEEVELFCIGTELTRTTLTHPNNWRQLISDIRGIYKGYLVYAANWYEEFSQLKFWDALDYAGVDPYFPLTEAKKPSVEELKKAWEPWVRELQRWQKEINKPVLFTEVGYKSCEGSADSPWEHVPGAPFDAEVQANCYQALLETFFSKEWFWGVYWWYWSTSVNARIAKTRGFNLQGKPAQEVVTRWYKKSDPGPDKLSSFKQSPKEIPK